MIKWLFEKLIGWPWCLHKWSIIKETSLDVADDDGEIVRRGHRYVLQCARCGDLMKRDLA